MSPLFLLPATLLLAILPKVFAGLQCSAPPYDAKAFVDLSELAKATIVNNGKGGIQTPKECSLPIHAGGNSSLASCDSQLCCRQEVGCCYLDPVTGKHSCGCKKKDEVECTRPAPLTVIRASGCKPHKRVEISVCIRRTRHSDHDEGIYRHVDEPVEKETRADSVSVTAIIPDTDLSVEYQWYNGE